MTTPIPARLRIVPFQPGYTKAYREFAHAAFGPSTYQATERYLHWLYACNPLSRGAACDAWLAVTEDEQVAGCIHTMRLLWTWRGEKSIVPSLHNTMMQAEHRGVAGGMLILQAFKGESHAFVPGAEGAVADSLGRMGFQIVTTSWARKIIRPVSGGLALLRHRLTGFQPQPALWSAVALELTGHPALKLCGPSLGVHQLGGCVQLANAGDEEIMRPHWTPESYHWRFFHPDGPRHLLLISGSIDAPEGYAVLSLGVRHGVRLGRVVDFRVKQPDLLARLLAGASDVIRRSGGHILMHYATADGTQPGLKYPGWRSYSSPAQTLFFHRQRSAAPKAHRFTAGAGDYGFEALLTKNT